MASNSLSLISFSHSKVVTGRREIHTVKGRKEPLEVFEVLGLQGND